jgi:MFS family permease
MSALEDVAGSYRRLLGVTGYTLGQALTGPLRGRLADRRGLAVVCAVCGVLYALALLCLLVGSLAGSLPSSPVGSSAGQPVLSLAVAVGTAGATAGICYGKCRLGPRDHAAKPSHTINFGRSPLILRGIWLYDRFLMLHFPAMKRPIMGKPKP